jgi:rifampin ADP-ribosylating transferase
MDKAVKLYETITENHDHLAAWLPFPKHTHSAEDTKAFIGQKNQEWEEGLTYAYSIENDGKLIGVTDLRGLKDGDKTPEIGYWISSAAAGKGITTKVTQALTELGFETFNLSKIMIRAHVDNHASNRVAEKAGFTRARQYEDSEGAHNVWEKAGPKDKGPFYHGTKADLKTGDLLTAGFKSNYRPEVTMNHIYFAATANGAGLAAELSKGKGRPRVYIVEPTGEFEDDPNVTNKKFPGNPTRSYRSRAPLKIVGETDDWVRLTPEALQRWREKLANIKGEIVN